MPQVFILREESRPRSSPLQDSSGKILNKGIYTYDPALAIEGGREREEGTVLATLAAKRREWAANENRIKVVHSLCFPIRNLPVSSPTSSYSTPNIVLHTHTSPFCDMSCVTVVDDL